MYIYISPFKYVQGEGALKELSKHVEGFGKKCLVIASNSALVDWEGYLRECLGNSEVIIENFGGKLCSKKQVDRLVELGKQEKVDFVIGFGGGTPQDTAKAVAFKLGYIPVVIIPTIAASDAPTTAVSVIYKEDGSFDEYWLYKQNPNLIVVDTGIIARAPARYLVAGMGDAIATKFEADACVMAGGRAVNGGYATELARVIADRCYEITLEYGLMAKESVERKMVTPALEKVVEANTLLSGLGCENNGIASAHGIHDGLTVLEEVHSYLHGEKVAFCTIVQLVMEGKSPAIINEVISFCIDVGLPVTLAELGVQENIEEKMELVSKSVDFNIAGNHSFEVTPQKIYNSILTADYLGRKFLRSRV